MAVKYWTDKISFDVEKAAKDAAEEALDEELEKLIEEGYFPGGVKVERPNWAGR